jgi:hypothetical protein
VWAAAGPAADHRLFPATYYVNPGADALLSYRGEGSPPALSLSAPDAATPAPGAPSAGRASLAARLLARFRGVEEVERHTLGCPCGRHPSGASGKGAAAEAATATATASAPTPGRVRIRVPGVPPSIWPEPRDLAEQRRDVERVAAERLDEPPER